MSDEMFFLPFFGSKDNLPFSVKVERTEPFRNVLERVVQLLAKNDASLIDRGFDISTASADIPLEQRDLDLDVSQVREIHGNSFSIRLGNKFHVKE